MTDIMRFSGTSTAACLRILADLIEKGESPDFVLLISDGKEYRSAHKSTDDPFGLLGLIEKRKLIILDEID